MTSSNKGCDPYGLLYIVSGILLWIPALTILIVTFVPFLIIGLGVHLLASILRPDLIPIKNPIDNFLITGLSTSFHVVNCTQIWKLNEKLEVKQFLEHFQNVFLSSPELIEKYRNRLYCFKKAGK
jgi:hypothetical protein